MKGNEPPEDTIEESQTALETESIRTDDDPVSDAFKKVLLEGSEDDDDEEQDEIVWDPRYYSRTFSLHMPDDRHQSACIFSSQLRLKGVALFTSPRDTPYFFELPNPY